MKFMQSDLTPQLQLSLEQFYYREARYLDNRQYQQWLALVTEDIQYTMPSRVNVQVNNRDKGTEEMISVERELETSDSMGCPIREENYVHLMVRVERAYKMNSWSENPPARVRRIVGNVELMDIADQRMTVWSNFLLFYSRPGCSDVQYSGQRRDVLLRDDDDYKIDRREIILNYTTINVPTLGLLF